MPVPDTRLVVVVDSLAQSRPELVDFVRGLGLIAIPVADLASATVLVRKLRLDLVLVAVHEADFAAVAAISDFKRRKPGLSILLLAGSDRAEALLRRADAGQVVRWSLGLTELEAPIRRLLRLQAPVK